MNTASLVDDPHWYKDAQIYEVALRAFKDSNNDGIGDLVGLIEQLDYLVDLGVTTIWLLPFYPPPLRDGGYDIADFYLLDKCTYEIGYELDNRPHSLAIPLRGLLSLTEERR